jgi:hypothetical protein
MNKLTKDEISTLGYELSANKMLPLKYLGVFIDPISGLHKIRFVSKDKQLDVSLPPDREYDDESIEKQLKEHFLGGKE